MYRNKLFYSCSCVALGLLWMPSAVMAANLCDGTTDRSTEKYDKSGGVVSSGYCVEVYGQGDSTDPGPWAILDNITVQSGGRVNVMGTLKDSTLESGSIGYIGRVSVIDINRWGYRENAVAIGDNLTIDNGSIMNVHVGGVIKNSDIYGRVNIYWSDTFNPPAGFPGGESPVGGTGRDNEVFNGGILSISNGGIGYDSIIHSGGQEWISKAASASKTGESHGSLVEDGAKQIVYLSGQSYGATIHGQQLVYTNAESYGATVYGLQQVYNNGKAYDTIVDGGLQQVATASNVGGYAKDTTVKNGGGQTVSLASRVEDTTLHDTSTQLVSGITTNTILNDASKSRINAGGQAMGVTDVHGNAQIELIAAAGVGGVSVGSGGAYADNVILHDATTQIKVLSGANDFDAAYIGSLSGQGKVVFDKLGAAKYSDLVINSLSGTQSFVMNTDIAAQTSDTMHITTTSGSHKVTIVNDGGQVTTGTESFDMVFTGDGAASFTGTNMVELGGYEYTFGRSPYDSKNWGIYGSREISSSANASASFATASYLMNYVDTSMLMQRMGELRASEGLMNGNFWTRGFGGKINSFSVGKIDGFTMSYGGVQFGVDKVFDVKGGTFYGGVMVGYTSGNPDYENGDGSFKSYHGGVYGTYLMDNGFYIDALLKYIHQRNEFTVTDTAGDTVSGHASSDGWGASVEIGKRYWLGHKRFYIEPQAQLSYTSQGDYTARASNWLRVSVDGVDSLLGRIGGTFGYQLDHVRSPTHVYAKAYYVREFLGDVDYYLNTSREGHSFEGNWGDFAVGFNTQIQGRHNIYGEVGYATGDRFDNTRTNIGYRVQF